MDQKIPIRNIYYLLSYAWDFVGRGEEDHFSNDTFKDSTELFARIFDVCLTVIARRGFAKEYEPVSEAIKGIRGKFELSQTVKSASLFRGQAHCTFDEHSFDCALNRIVKATLVSLLKDRALSSQSAMNLRNHLLRLDTVSAIELSKESFRSITYSSHQRHYRFVIELSRLVFENLAISNEGREVHVQNFLEKDVQMHRVFETFVRRFYDKQLDSGYKVSAEKYNWKLGAGDSLFGDRVPELKTDVTIHSDNRVIIMDAKYYSEALTRSFGSFKYRRDHLSQLMDYLRAAKARHSKPVNGILLYPTTSQKIYDRGEIEGFDITVATIDLSQDWNGIHDCLLEIISRTFQGRVPAA